MFEQIEFPNCISNASFEDFCKALRTVKFKYLGSDHLHHKYDVQSDYTIDYFEIGKWVGKKIMVAQKLQTNG